jgi:hypothetical protein
MSSQADAWAIKVVFDEIDKGQVAVVAGRIEAHEPPKQIDV